MSGTAFPMGLLVIVHSGCYAESRLEEALADAIGRGVGKKLLQCEIKVPHHLLASIITNHINSGKQFQEPEHEPTHSLNTLFSTRRCKG